MKTIREPNYTQEDLHRLFEYKGGKLYRKVTTSSNAIAGNVVGTKMKNGYSTVSIGKVHHYLHRVIYQYHFGINLNGVIDHIDGNPSNNNIENLRLCSRMQNQQNIKRMGNRKYDLPKGVSFDAGKHRVKRYVAQIRVNGKNTVIGRFHTPEEAHVAYCNAADKYFGEFARYG
jgi:hypothetical protein